MNPGMCYAALPALLVKNLNYLFTSFLKEALVRKFGTDFYDALHQIAVEHFEEENPKK